VSTPARMLVISVVIMASTLVCRGSIIVTWLDEPIGIGGWWNPSTPQPVDIDGDGVVDFSFWGDQFNTSAGFRSFTLNRYLITPSPPPNIGGAVAALDEGFLIASGSTNEYLRWFGDDHDYWSTLMSQLSSGREGEFWGVRAYIGIEFEIDSAVHYGWIDVQGHSSLPNLTVYGWAYESTPGMPIMAGAIPEPSALSLIGIGAIAILYRKKSIANNRPHPTPHKCGEGGP